MNARDLDWYKRLLLAKLDELSATRSGAETPLPGADERPGDLVDQANSDAEAELQIGVHHSDVRLLRAIEEALARIRQGTFGDPPRTSLRRFCRFYRLCLNVE